MASRYDEIESQRVAFEPVFIPLIRAELIRQGEQAAAAYEAGSTPEMAAGLVQTAGLVRVLSDLYVAVGTSFARAEYDFLTDEYQKAHGETLQTKRLPGAELVSGWVSRLRRFFTGEGTTRVRAMQETTRDIITRVLTKARLDGLSIPEAADALRKEVTTLSQARAVIVARTEIVSSSNAASLMGAQSTGLKLLKGWLATSDARTRASHRAANGQLVSLDGSFTVEGEALRYPGDPLASARNVVQCRCAITYKPA